MKPHVTILYIGKDTEGAYKNLVEYREFRTGKHYNIVMEGVVVCRDHILTVKVSTRLLPPIQGTPYVTLYTGAMSSSDGSLLLDALPNSD